MIREFTTNRPVDHEETKVDLLEYNATIAALETAIALKAPFLDPTILNSAVLPANTTIGTVSATEISYLDGVTSAIQGQLDLKAPLASPTFTGTPTAPTAATATDTTQLATTAFVQQELTTGAAHLARTAMLMAFAASHG